MFVVDVWVVPGDDPLFTASIAPTLAPGDVIVLSRHATLNHGYLTRCPDPEAPGRFVLARAIAHGGESISFNREIVLVDGHHTPSARACDPGMMVLRDPNSNSDVTLNCEIEEYGEADFEVLRSAINPVTAGAISVDTGRWFLVSDAPARPLLDSRDFGQVDPRSASMLVRVAWSMWASRWSGEGPGKRPADTWRSAR